MIGSFILAVALSVSSFVYADDKCPCRENGKSCPNYTCDAVTGKGPCKCCEKMPKGELIPVTIQIPVKIDIKSPGRIKEIVANTTGDNVQWIIYPDENVDLITKDDSGKKVIFSTDTEGVYYLTAVTASYDETTKKANVVKSNTCLITVGKPKPPPPPDNPPDDGFDSLQKKLSAEYIKLGKPKADTQAVAKFHSDALDMINDKSVLNTQSLDLKLHAVADGILGNKVPTIRDLCGDYLKTKVNLNPVTLTDDVRALWSKEFKYVSDSLMKVAK